MHRLSLIVMHGLLTAIASLVAERGLQSSGSVVVSHGLSSPRYVGSSGPGIKPVSPTLAGEFLTTESSENSLTTFPFFFFHLLLCWVFDVVYRLSPVVV